MIYKKYEFSLSLNGTKIVHIARNAAGFVVFRESSEAKLKKAIDKSIEEKQRQEELEAKERADKARAKAKAKKRALFAARVEPEEEPEKEKEAKTQTSVPPAPRITRGPDGKFISKAQETENEPKKKSFWDKLKA